MQFLESIFPHQATLALGTLARSLGDPIRDAGPHSWFSHSLHNNGGQITFPKGQHLRFYNEETERRACVLRPVSGPGPGSVRPLSLPSCTAQLMCHPGSREPHLGPWIPTCHVLKIQTECVLPDRKEAVACSCVIYLKWPVGNRACLWFHKRAQTPPD